ncbi:MAG: hypothetical protein Q9218_008281, partial [Villophora microphyllina]
MAGRYIPPHLRQKDAGQQGTPSSSSAPQLQIKERSLSDGYTPEEIANQFGLPSTEKVGTLNADESGKLAFVLVFKDQHPEWPPKIFCKSNLHLLSSSSAGGSPSQTSTFNSPKSSEPIANEA